MNLSDPIAALEVGTTHTMIAVGEPLDGGRIRIAAYESIPSSGVRKSQIVDVAQARFSIESVLKRLADQSDYSIGQAYLVVSGPQIRTKAVNGQCQVDGGIVQDETLEEAESRAAYETGLSAEREAIELVRVCYRLDDIDGIASPKGMNGRLLTLRTICIHGSTQRIADARTAARGARLEILPETYFAGTCAAAAVLTPQNKREGALVIDLGGGSTAYTAWADGHLLHAGVIGVGGDHVTNDIRIAFSISLAQAEGVKTAEACAVISAEDAMQRISVPNPMPGFQTATISRRALNTVVNARLQELFTIIRDTLNEENVLHRLNAGVILTGGGSALRGVAELAASVFGGTVRVGTLVSEIEGLEAHPHPAACATIAGLLLLARQENAQPPSFLDTIKKTLGGFFRK